MKNQEISVLVVGMGENFIPKERDVLVIPFVFGSTLTALIIIILSNDIDGVVFSREFSLENQLSFLKVFARLSRNIKKKFLPVPIAIGAKKILSGILPAKDLHQACILARIGSPEPIYY